MKRIQGFIILYVAVKFLKSFASIATQSFFAKIPLKQSNAIKFTENVSFYYHMFCEGPRSFSENISYPKQTSFMRKSCLSCTVCYKPWRDTTNWKNVVRSGQNKNENFRLQPKLCKIMYVKLRMHITENTIFPWWNRVVGPSCCGSELAVTSIELRNLKNKPVRSCDRLEASF